MTEEKEKGGFTAVVLAGDRGAEDPLRLATGVKAKALIRIGGKIMVGRVVEALLASSHVNRILLCGPPAAVLESSRELKSYLKEPALEWLENDSGPSRSTACAFAKIDAEEPVLLTTADHALLTPEMVDFFCAEAARSDSGADIALGIADFNNLKKRYPESRRTTISCRDGTWCSCNLFAFLTPAGRRITETWQELERNRKKPQKLVGLCGFSTLAAYLLGRLTFDELLSRLAARLGCNAIAVRLPWPEAAIDVDKPADLDLVRRIVKER